jgi:hypothetical protein
MHKTAFVAIVSMVLMVSIASAADGSGGYAASFLQVPIGARPTAMGGAYLAVSNDGAGALYNPAGLAGLQRPLFGTSYRVLRLDRKLGYATLLFPVANQATLGFNWLYAGSGSVAMRDQDGLPTGDNFSMNNHVFSIIFAKRFESYMSVGAKLNYFQSSIPHVTAASIGIDIGAMLYVNELIDREVRDKFPLTDLQVGFTIKNLAAKYIWNSEKFNQAYIGLGTLGYEQTDQLPTEIGLGVSSRINQRKLLLDVDVVGRVMQGKRLDQYGAQSTGTSSQFVVRPGGEYFVTPEFAVRTGFSENRFTVGTGYVFKLKKSALAIDYAFSTARADEGSEHIFSFDLLY